MKYTFQRFETVKISKLCLRPKHKTECVTRIGSDYLSSAPQEKVAMELLNIGICDIEL